MRRYGLVGKHLSYSFSARYFAEKFASLGIADSHTYDLWEIPSIDVLPHLLADNPDVKGFNVTIPYKQQIIPLLDSLSAEAEAVGAVNCVKIMPDGSLRGYNTDIDGIRLSLDKLLGREKISSALILGSGGAAKAVRYVLSELGIQAKIVSRSSENGDLIYDELTNEVIADNQLIVNASPVGVHPQVEAVPAIPYQFLTSSHYLFDLIYNPTLTTFMKRGLAVGAHAISGIDMLYAQADKAWQIWCE